MRAADDIDDYRADRIGAYLALSHGLVFCASPALWGFALWGRPTAADVDRIPPLIHDELDPDVEPHASLVDLSRLESADPAAFMPLIRYLEAHEEAIGARHTRVAVVRPSGFLGMIVAGFHDVVSQRYPVRVFDDLAAAAAWVDGEAVVAGLEDAIARCSSRSAPMVQLRRWLDENPLDATLEQAARALGRAPRSLQRDLKDMRSSFQRELDAARIRRAKGLLALSASSLTEIAYEVGCASPQHFSVLFRRLSGMAPSAWRARHRPR